MEQITNNEEYRPLTKEEIEKSLLEVFENRRPKSPNIVLFADKGFMEGFDKLMKEEFKKPPADMIMPLSSVTVERLTPDEIIEKYGDMLSESELEALTKMKNK